MTGQFPPAGSATPRQRALHATGTPVPASPHVPAIAERAGIITAAAASSGRAMDRRGALAISQQGLQRSRTGHSGRRNSILAYKDEMARRGTGRNGSFGLDGEG